MEQISVLGIDLAKSVFQFCGVDRDGKTILNKKLKREAVLRFVANLPLCKIGLEACGGAHYWAREFRSFGHEVKLISPQFVKPYVKSNKNDQRDAEAIVEAMMRPTMRFVPIKSIEAQDIQCVHRVRERLIKNRTALSNEIRGLLSEYGIVCAKSIATLRKQLPLIIEDADNQLSIASRRLFDMLLDELRNLGDLIAFYEIRIQEIYRSNEACQRVGKIEGVGPITATAIVAAASDARVFKNGRQFSAWLGLVPRENSSGGKTRLLGISKRGDRYLRYLLIHGARAVLQYGKAKTDKKSLWIQRKIETRGFNKACVALANKNARVIWAMMASGETYRKSA